MNIDDLTVGQAKELARLLTLGDNGDGSKAYAAFIGEDVIVRSHNEGINFGTVVRADAESVTLSNARRIWYHRPADRSQSWYEGVANTGLSNDSTISAPVKMKLIVEDYSITLCTEVAVKSLREAVTHAQS